MALAVAVIALAALLAAVRAWQGERRLVSLKVWGQPLLALLLWLLLFPPDVTQPTANLIVLTPGATSAQQRALPWLATVVALPGSQTASAIEFAPETAPDLATALRHHPDASSLSIIGNGLPPRDQDAAAALPMRFDPSPARGLLALNAPQRVLLGTQWLLDGRAAASAVRAELSDPAGAVIDTTSLDRDGRFRLSAYARAAGPARFELRLFDAKQALVETAAVPIVAEPGEDLRAIVRAGAPDPEFKYWRRWAADAGIALTAAAGLSEGISLRDGDAALTQEALAAADFVIVDERAWISLTTTEQAALLGAVREGLGLLLRVGGPLAPEVAAEWAAFGIRTQTLDAPHEITIDKRSGLRERASFTAAPVEVESEAMQTLLAADNGEALGLWRSEGLGRIGVWRLLDSYRLILLGETARYGSLWQRTLAQIARARPAMREPRLPEASWLDERSVFCGLGDAASVIATDGKVIPLIQDSQHCAAFWPAQAGWQRLQTGADELPFYVRAADDAPGLRASRDRVATQRLIRADAADGRSVTDKIRLPRWPFLIAFLLCAAGLWWRERPT